MRIVCAIPHYNQGESLSRLLPKLLKEPFDAVYVLDDNSDPGQLDFIQKTQAQRLRIIKGGRNLGAAGNRNRLLEFERDGVVWFLDADMELISKKNHYALDRMFTHHRRHGAFGGLIRHTNGKPMLANYGYFFHPIKSPVGELISKAGMKTTDIKRLQWLRQIAKPYTYNLEILAMKPQERDVQWTAEGNFATRLELFQELGGFDPKLNYHEGQDYCQRIWQAGFKVGFNPTLESKHLQINVRRHKKSQKRLASIRLMTKG
jgi:GT2 family glycosyltransferase